MYNRVSTELCTQGRGHTLASSNETINILYGEGGNDMMVGADIENIIDGGAGNDTIIGGEEND